MLESDKMSWAWKRGKSTDYREEDAKDAAMEMLKGNPAYRQETAVRVTERGTVDANTPSTAIPTLIMLDPINKYDAESQAIVAREDPIAGYIINRVAEVVYDDGFTLVKKGTDELHEYNDPIQDELIRMNGSRKLTQWLAAEREFGWAWLDLIPANNNAEDFREDDSNNELQPKIAMIDVYTPLFTEVVTWDKKGQPLTLKVNITLPDGSLADLPDIDAKDTILMRTRPFGDRTFRGLSVLVGIWDALTYIRQVLFSMGWYSIKTGIGVFYVKIRGAVTQEKVDAAKAVLTGLSTKRGIIYSDLVIDEFGFIQSDGGSINFPDYVDALLSQVAIRTGIPKQILAGMADSSLGGAEVNSDIAAGLIGTEQQGQEYYLRELFFRMGFEGQDYDFKWPSRFATSKTEESKILMNDTQSDAVAVEAYMTINEVRERRGLPSIEGGDEMLNLRDTSKITADLDFQTPEEEESTNNPNQPEGPDK